MAVQLLEFVTGRIYKVMKRWLAIPLVLLLLQRADSQNMVVGNALPCGDDNLSCVDVPTTCLTVDQICNSNLTDCFGPAIDEGGALFASLDCKRKPLLLHAALSNGDLFLCDTQARSRRFGARILKWLRWISSAMV